MYRSFYHSTGLVMAASSEKGGEDVTNYVRAYKSSVRLLSSPSDFRSTMPNGVLTGDFPGWKGCFREEGAGWLFARGALQSVFQEACRLGVQFMTGSVKGKVERLIYSSSDILGAQTADGIKHLADRTILCAGANSDILFNFEQQLRPTAWTLAHIQMTPDERKLWKNLPVLFNVERGFFIVCFALQVAIAVFFCPNPLCLLGARCREGRIEIR